MTRESRDGFGGLGWEDVVRIFRFSIHADPSGLVRISNAAISGQRIALDYEDFSSHAKKIIDSENEIMIAQAINEALRYLLENYHNSADLAAVLDGAGLSFGVSGTRIVYPTGHESETKYTDSAIADVFRDSVTMLHWHRLDYICSSIMLKKRIRLEYAEFGQEAQDIMRTEDRRRVVSALFRTMSEVFSEKYTFAALDAVLQDGRFEFDVHDCPVAINTDDYAVPVPRAAKNRNRRPRGQKPRSGSGKKPGVSNDSLSETNLYLKSAKSPEWVNFGGGHHPESKTYWGFPASMSGGRSLCGALVPVYCEHIKDHAAEKKRIGAKRFDCNQVGCSCCYPLAISKKAMKDTRKMQGFVARSRTSGINNGGRNAVNACMVSLDPRFDYGLEGPDAEKNYREINEAVRDFIACRVDSPIMPEDVVKLGTFDNARSDWFSMKFDIDGPEGAGLPTSVRRAVSRWRRINMKRLDGLTMFHPTRFDRNGGKLVPRRPMELHFHAVTVGFVVADSRIEAMQTAAKRRIEAKIESNEMLDVFVPGVDRYSGLTMRDKVSMSVFKRTGADDPESIENYVKEFQTPGDVFSHVKYLYSHAALWAANPNHPAAAESKRFMNSHPQMASYYGGLSNVGQRVKSGHALERVEDIRSRIEDDLRGFATHDNVDSVIGLTAEAYETVGKDGKQSKKFRDVQSVELGSCDAERIDAVLDAMRDYIAKRAATVETEVYPAMPKDGSDLDGEPPEIKENDVHLSVTMRYVAKVNDPEHEGRYRLVKKDKRFHWLLGWSRDALCDDCSRKMRPGEFVGPPGGAGNGDFVLVDYGLDANGSTVWYPVPRAIHDSHARLGLGVDSGSGWYMHGLTVMERMVKQYLETGDYQTYLEQSDYCDIVERVNPFSDLDSQFKPWVGWIDSVNEGVVSVVPRRCYADYSLPLPLSEISVEFLQRAFVTNRVMDDMRVESMKTSKRAGEIRSKFDILCELHAKDMVHLREIVQYGR